MIRCIMAKKGKAAQRWRRIRIANGYYDSGGMGTIHKRLGALGFKKYSDYLVSAHWQEFRTKIIAKRGYRCEICPASGVKIALHHRTYERLGNESEDDIILVCPDCHDRIHKSERMGGKGGLEGALKRVMQRVAKGRETA
jgi:hypothetical protein